MSSSFGAVPGRVNGLADVPGIAVGHAPARDDAGTPVSSGVTVVTCPSGAVGAVDVRGGGPGARETDLLRPSNSMQAVHAVALCGGSAFGLDAAGGVMSGLEERGIGFPVFGDAVPDGPIVPIVPAAVIFDLPVGSPAERPDADCGREALVNALGTLDELPGVTGPSVNGCVGAGRAATAGALKGGFGQASAVLPTGETVAVGLVANPVGSVVDPLTGWPWGLGAELDHDGVGEFDRYWGGLPDPDDGGLAALLARGLGGTKLPPPDASAASVASDGSPLNTVIGVVATDAPVTKAQAERLAMAAHDGLARAVRPSHLPMDGDTFFALSTGGGGETGAGVPGEELALLATVAADCAERAVVHAVLAASSMYDVPSWTELMS
ncbi:P1 family peptidase [Corynebacterium sp.]|jgi:L-aminopeptidase/D-esterase-like protein|uniref:P1 family peptidase n=1 Tax=Corynebacterium sp. TaxID=1720 RepID=UPI0025BE4A78|nr:P1 family peptidase [Corynebacterium sp.]